MGTHNGEFLRGNREIATTFIIPLSSSVISGGGAGMWGAMTDRQEQILLSEIQLHHHDGKMLGDTVKILGLVMVRKVLHSGRQNLSDKHMNDSHLLVVHSHTIRRAEGRRVCATDGHNGCISRMSLKREHTKSRTHAQTCVITITRTHVNVHTHICQQVVFVHAHAFADTKRTEPHPHG